MCCYDDTANVPSGSPWCVVTRITRIRWPRFPGVGYGSCLSSPGVLPEVECAAQLRCEYPSVLSLVSVSVSLVSLSPKEL